MEDQPGLDIHERWRIRTALFDKFNSAKHKEQRLIRRTICSLITNVPPNEVLDLRELPTQQQALATDTMAELIVAKLTEEGIDSGD